jgi:hypothetical protein
MSHETPEGVDPWQIAATSILAPGQARDLQDPVVNREPHRRALLQRGQPSAGRH